MLWSHLYSGEPVDQKASGLYASHESFLHYPGLISFQRAPRETFQGVHKDRENTSESEHLLLGLTQPQLSIQSRHSIWYLVLHVQMASTSFSAANKGGANNPLDLIRDTGLLFLQLRLPLEGQTNTEIAHAKYLKSCARGILTEPLCFDYTQRPQKW